MLKEEKKTRNIAKINRNDMFILSILHLPTGKPRCVFSTKGWYSRIKYGPAL